MNAAIREAKRLGAALDTQAAQAHAMGRYDEWRDLHAQAVGVTRLEMRLKRAMRRRGN